MHTSKDDNEINKTSYGEVRAICSPIIGCQFVCESNLRRSHASGWLLPICLGVGVSIDPLRKYTCGNNPVVEDVTLGPVGQDHRECNARLVRANVEGILFSLSVYFESAN
jgi:hypothetical protein